MNNRRQKGGFRRPDQRGHHRPPSQKSTERQPSGAMVIGRNAVREVLRHKSDRVLSLTVSTKGGGDSEILDLARDIGLKIDQVDPTTLTAIAKSESHQGVIAIIKDRPGMELKELVRAEEGKEQSIVVLVDAVQDPQNIGAIFRAAECMGAAGVVLSKNRSPSITPAVTKVSVGASELLNVVYVSNLSEAVRKLKDSDYWIVAARAGEGSEDIRQFSFPKRVAIVLGSEEEGIQSLIEKEADFAIKIPLFGRIDSLNVSQAAAVILYAARAQVHA